MGLFSPPKPSFIPPKTLPDTKGEGGADAQRKRQAAIAGGSQGTILTSPLGTGTALAPTTLLGA